MNANKIFLFLTIALILLVISACGPAPATETPVPTQDTAINTSLAETAQAGVFGTLTQLALSIPSDTPTPLFTETPINTSAPLPSATSSKPMISVVMETLCRLGPDMVYDRVGALGVGTMAEVYAMDPSRSYYFIQNPNQPGSYCWVWGFYATPVNNFVGMPIYTPAFTPTIRYTSTPTITRTPTGTLTPMPAFTVTNPKIRECSPNKYLDVTITNTGGTVFKSGSVEFNDTTVPATVAAIPQNTFRDLVGCDVHYEQGDLAPKEVGNLSSDAIPFDVSGHNLTVTVKVCPLDDLGGTCSVQSFTYKP
ncbi:MAG: hypothetical protein A2X25_04145 [Chloroflexi bacterium GWB2_49_20]|nr:MAG: hypothetical protein A2X25_04145 [Chloroflexi bacterium GWB2_49_20]OGN76774.1 MAG: hypothetical protein A2X26_11235 [Chloroflexi bacterium GWC2_49_37]OGN83734.1 MAG: hypothetical protein A2X27_01890 [Chloroflexi bacterium GWD2_49_16]HBG74141.1 hypothetical protein [Anaerolineae bacterium]HCC79041.1 hypothetical protein [Anaerolineae bacterium]